MSVAPGDLIKFLRNLRAVRDYTPEPVPDAAINDIIEVARWSGSASNRQPVELMLVRDNEIKQLIAQHGAGVAAGAALVILPVTPGDQERQHLEIFDDGRLVERLLLAAKAHGLGSNISSLKGEGPAVVKQALGIPAERRIWSVVTVGHIDHEARAARPKSPTAGRRPVNEFVHWDRF